MKINNEVVERTIDDILKTEHLLDIKRKLKSEGYSGTQVNTIVKKAKDFIKEYTSDTWDIQKEMIVYRLNEISLNATQTSDVLSALDKLAKIIGAYTTKVSLDKDVTFVLGTDLDEWKNIDLDETEEDAE